MRCTQCGAVLVENASFCTNCGVRFRPIPASPPPPRPATGGVGYSTRINDPAFARYLKNTNRWSAIFAVILAVAAVVGFAIYGEVSDTMDNPQALFIGVGIGAMFLMVALYTVIARKRSRTWDGVVVDKSVKNKTRREGSRDDTLIHYYTEFAVIVRDQRGKDHRLTAEDDDTVFNYFQIGDHVRHHAGLNSYEKYDKSRDAIIFCNACATLCRITDDACPRCHCPLLK